MTDYAEKARNICRPPYSGAVRVDDAQHVEDVAAALRTPHGLPGEEELVLLMRQNLSVDVSNYGLSADIEGIEDAARAILSRLTASREDVK